MSAAAKSNLKRVTLELGGKSPLIIFSDVERRLYYELFCDILRYVLRPLLLLLYGTATTVLLPYL